MTSHTDNVSSIESQLNLSHSILGITIVDALDVEIHGVHFLIQEVLKESCDLICN